MGCGCGCPLTWMGEVLAARVPYFGDTHVGHVLSSAFTTSHLHHRADIQLVIAIQDAIPAHVLRHNGLAAAPTCDSSLVSRRSRKSFSTSKPTIGVYAIKILLLLSATLQASPMNSAGDGYPFLALPAMGRTATENDQTHMVSGSHGSRNT